MAHGHRREPLGTVDPGRQRLDAAPRGMYVQPRNRTQRNDLVLGGTLLARGDEQVLPHHHLVVRAGGTVRRGRQRLVSAPAPRTENGPQEHRHCLGLRLRIRARHGDDGRQVGRRHRPRAADETRSHGGALRRAAGCAPDGHRHREARGGTHFERGRILFQDRHPETALDHELPRRRRLCGGHQRPGERQREIRRDVGRGEDGAGPRRRG